jgi:hypothetical protein
MALSTAPSEAMSEWFSRTEVVPAQPQSHATATAMSGHFKAQQCTWFM